MIRQIPEQPSAYGADKETRGKKQGSIELLHDWVRTWKERSCKIQSEGRISVEIVPLDQITDRPDKNGSDPPPHVREVFFAGLGSQACRHDCLIPKSR
jgi:hypothetical protein